jgi:nicotinate-nucleotide adenylyltransferase
MIKVGILGGTFDPIHYGHLAAAEGARHLLGLQQVYLMPNGQPPHKAGRTVTPAHHRRAMVERAIQSNPHLALLTEELDRAEPSYTVDTLRRLTAAHPDWEIYFLVGMDSLIDLPTWKEPYQILRLAHLVAVNRPGFATEVGEAVRRSLPSDLQGRVHLLTIPGVAVASRELRHLVAQGYSLRYLVPDAVIAYLTAHRLYVGPSEED